jgi:hypothetical protein
MFTRSTLGLFVLAFTTGCWEEEDKSEGTDDTGLTEWSSSSSYGDDRYTETGSDCEEECGALWREVYGECIDGGGSEEDCEMRADEAYEACVEGCGERTDTEETEEHGGDCEEECGALWREVYGECIDGGGSEEDCEIRADEAQRACLADCEETERETDETERETDETERETDETERETDETERGDCEDECLVLWREVYGECIDGGASEEDCEARADEAYEDCAEGCHATDDDGRDEDDTSSWGDCVDCDEYEYSWDDEDETERETETETETETEREEECADGDTLERGDETYICRDGGWYLEE